MNDFRQHLQEDQERLLRDMRALVEDCEALLRHAAQDAGEGYREARQRLEQRLQAAREGLAAAQARAQDHAEFLQGYAREHPWRVIGAGVGLGLLAGLLLGGSRKD